MKVPHSTIHDPRPPLLRCTSDDDIQLPQQEMIKTGINIALLHVLPSSALVSASSSSAQPPSPPVVRERLLKNLKALPQPLHLYDIANTCVDFLMKLMYTEEQRTNIEIATRKQSDSR